MLYYGMPGAANARMAAMDADGAASRTAVLVCQGRAAAHGRMAVGRFGDPVAAMLLRDGERAVVEQVRTGIPPEGWRPRLDFELVGATAEGMVPRTVAIDDAIRARPVSQLVILGAGLDTRAWRMPELAETTVFEVDHPASQRDKQDRIGRLTPLAGSLRFAPVDFARDRLDAALDTAGHRRSLPTTWLWEGVVPYLTRHQVAATVEVVQARSAPGSRLIVNYQHPSPTAVLGRMFVRSLSRLARRDDPLAGEPRRSSWTPAALHRLLGRHGFTVCSDHDLQSLAEGLSIQVRHRRSLRTGRVLVADLEAGPSSAGWNLSSI
jgi:methyltransferase (TIGR00027 family)